MTPAQRWTAWGTTVPLVLTGGLYAWMAYGMTPAGPFDLVNHPWQPTVLQLHLLVAPAWLVGLGVLWATHVLPKLRAGRRARTRSGLGLLALALPMVASGYLLQTSADDGWRAAWKWTHVATSAAWTLAFAGHVRPRRRAAVHSPMPSRARSSGEAGSATVPGGCT